MTVGLLIDTEHPEFIGMMRQLGMPVHIEERRVASAWMQSLHLALEDDCVGDHFQTQTGQQLSDDDKSFDAFVDWFNKAVWPQHPAAPKLS
jgi:hypothetical protein